jgi:hypothetical protein
LPKHSAIILSILSATTIAASAAFAAGASSPPDFSPNPSVGWVAAGARYLPPPSGPGPVGAAAGRRQSANNEVRATGAQALFGMGDADAPILQPWARDRVKARNDKVLAGKPAFSRQSSCWPIGTPGFILYPVQPTFFVQTPKEVVMIFDGDMQVRHIYMDVPHSKTVKPSWYGESVGHYEGDTLVVDTIGQNTKGIIDPYRTPHTEKLHVVERWRRIDNGNGLEVEVTIDDPDTFNQPWKGVRRYRQAQQQVNEQVCAEGNFLLFDYGIPVAKTPDF